MGFDKNGNWESDFYPIEDRDNSVPITASKFQTLIQENLKQSFQNCILRDGTGLPTANINQRTCHLRRSRCAQKIYAVRNFPRLWSYDEKILKN